MQTKIILQILAIVLILNASLWAKQQEDMIDHLALASLMIYDARYKKAQEELRLVNKESLTYDAADYFTVVGVLNAKQIKTD